MARDLSLIGEDITKIVYVLSRAFPQLEVYRYERYTVEPSHMHGLLAADRDRTVSYGLTNTLKHERDALRIELVDAVLSITKYDNTIGDRELENILESAIPIVDFTYCVEQGCHQSSRWRCEYSRNAELPGVPVRNQGVSMKPTEQNRGATPSNTGTAGKQEALPDEVKTSKLSPRLKALLDKMQHPRPEDLALPDAFADQVRKIRIGST